MKLVSAILGGLIASVLVVWGYMALWASVIVPLIPVNEYTGLIKLGVGLALFLLFGGLGFWLIVAAAALVGALMAAITPGK